MWQRVFAVVIAAGIISAGLGLFDADDPPPTAAIPPCEPSGVVAFVASPETVDGDFGSGPNQAYVRDMRAGVTWQVSVDTGRNPNPEVFSAAASLDGAYVAFAAAGDEGLPEHDAYVRDRLTDETHQLNDAQWNDSGLSPSVSCGGEIALYADSWTEPTDAGEAVVTSWIVVDREAGTARPLIADAAGFAVGDRDSFAVVSARGEHVVFVGTPADSFGDDAAGVRQVYVHNVVGGGWDRVELVDIDGNPAANVSGATLSVGGRWVAIETDAALDPDDLNGVSDVYLVDRGSGETTWVSRHRDDDSALDVAFSPQVAWDGSFVVFASGPGVMVDGVAAGGVTEVFAYEAATGEVRPLIAEADGSGSGGLATSSSEGIAVQGEYVVFASADDDLDASGASARAGSTFVYAVHVATGDVTYLGSR